jgi:hypothetical protein
MSRAALLILAGSLAAASANSATCRNQPTAPADSALFSLVVRDLRSGQGMLFVDPNALVDDPTIGSVEGLPVPGEIAHASPDASFVRDSSLSAARARVLGSAGIKSRSIVEALRCGSRRFQAMRTGKKLSSSEECFGGQEFTVVLIAIPRAGGAYLPGTVDERAGNEARVSVRVITVGLSSSGNTESSMDLVFERSGESWKLVNRRVLIVAG